MVIYSSRLTGTPDENDSRKGDMRECWNRQTGTFEVRVSMTCGFKSHLSHQTAVPDREPLFCFRLPLRSPRRDTSDIKNRRPAFTQNGDIFLLSHTETLLEAVYTSACINQLLLAGVEGVALGTDLDSDIRLCGTGLDHISAGTGDGSLLIVGMDTLSHFKHLFSVSEILTANSPSQYFGQ